MKHLFAAILVIIAGIAYGQTSSALLNSYYGIKEALVKSDAAGASNNANEFLKLTGSIASPELKNKLNADGKLIATASNLKDQREVFARFSENFYTLVKTTNLTRQPVYHMYCPMKKSYWLSNEKAVQNPYYGNAMLKCGSVKDTINP